MATLNKQELLQALSRLGELAAQRGTRIELALFGGGIMVLVMGTREATRDVDVVVLAPGDPSLVRELARVVAGERSWPDDWLNDAVKGYLSELSDGPTIFSMPGIEVRRPSFEQLLAMKLCAWRDDVDIADARRLLQELSGGYNEVWRRVERFVQRGHELKARYAFDDLWSDLHGPH